MQQLTNSCNVINMRQIQSILVKYLDHWKLISGNNNMQKYHAFSCKYFIDWLIEKISGNFSKYETWVLATGSLFTAWGRKTEKERERRVLRRIEDVLKSWEWSCISLFDQLEGCTALNVQQYSLPGEPSTWTVAPFCCLFCCACYTLYLVIYDDFIGFKN